MEEATKIVIELDYELSPGAEERLKKFYDSAAKKSEKYGGWRSSKSSSKEQKKKAKVTINPEVFKKWEEMGGANENKRSYKRHASSNSEEESSDDGINWDRWDKYSRKFAEEQAKAERRKKFGATPFSRDIFEGMTPKSRLNMKYKLSLAGFNAAGMSDKDAFLTNENKKREEKLEREEERRRKEIFRTQMLEERKRSGLYGKLMRSAGIVVKGFAAVSVVKYFGSKLFGKLYDTTQTATNVLNKSFATRESAQNTQAFSSWLNDKGLNEQSAYATLDKYAETMNIKDQPYTKIMERFLKEAQKATPKQLQAALGHGADVEFLRKVKDYSGNFQEELKAFKGNVYSDEDLKTMEHLNVSWGRFLNTISKMAQPSLVSLAKKTGEVLDVLPSYIGPIVNGVGMIGNGFMQIHETFGKVYDGFIEYHRKLKGIGKFLGVGGEDDIDLRKKLGIAQENDRNPAEMIRELGKEAEASSTPLNERLAAAKGNVTSHEDSRRIVQNNSFNFSIRSTDPEKAAGESVKKIKEALMNKIFLPEGSLS